MIRRLLVNTLVSAVALWVADRLLPGFAVVGGLWGYLVAGLVLGLLNSLVRPLVKVVSLPLILLTLGLFTVIINMLMLVLAAHLTGLIVIVGLGTLFWATFIISLVHIVLDRIV